MRHACWACTRIVYRKPFMNLRSTGSSSLREAISGSSALHENGALPRRYAMGVSLRMNGRPGSLLKNPGPGIWDRTVPKSRTETRNRAMSERQTPRYAMRYRYKSMSYGRRLLPSSVPNIRKHAVCQVEGSARHNQIEQLLSSVL